MAEYIVMPKLGFDMREGVLVGWTKEIGEQVNRGDVVAEIESDKATLELESQVTGVLLKTLGEPDDVIPVGANLAIVGEAGEDISGMDQSSAAADGGDDVAEPEESTAPETAGTVGTTVEGSAEAPSGEAIGDEYPDGVKATPVARRMAEDKGIDLRQVNGTGPGGRIRKADVETFVEAGGAKVTVKSAEPAVQAVAAGAVEFTPTSVNVGAGSEEVKLTRLRQAIARRMTESKTTIPQFYVSTEIDMTAALKLRKEINASLEAEGIKVSVNDMIVKAVGLALQDFPNINASFAGDKVIRHGNINVGSAVAVEGGLLTVVQRNTNMTTLSQIAKQNKEMIVRARSGKVQTDDIQGSTFTVSNLGAFDVDHFIAIINPPEAAILAIGSAQQVPVVVDGELTIGNRMKVTISADHRVTDGVEAAQFNQRFKAIMENPMRLLL
jgi:pyruvate dehydrogenase E2 component (dihydrolipoamide acetyltransferase)